VAVPLPAVPENIVLVGPSARQGRRAELARRPTTISYGIDKDVAVTLPALGPIARVQAALAPPARGTFEIPAGAVWLDGSGTPRVHVPGGSGRRSNEPANPWIPRSAAGSALDLPLSCDGILFGADVEPVCWINGLPLRHGDRVGGFVVLGVRREEVVLGLDDAVYVLPLGRRAVVRILHASL
jgi:hypothetical protein